MLQQRNQAAQDKENNALFPKADDRSVQLGQTINIENMRAIVDSRREIMYESDGKLSNIAANTSKSSRKTTEDTDEACYIGPDLCIAGTHQNNFDAKNIIDDMGGLSDRS